MGCATDVELTHATMTLGLIEPQPVKGYKTKNGHYMRLPDPYPIPPLNP